MIEENIKGARGVERILCRIFCLFCSNPIVFVCVQYLIRVQSVRREIDELGVCFHKRASERGSMYEREREREREK